MDFGFPKSGGDEEDLLNHAFAQNALFAAVGMEQEYGIAVGVNDSSVFVDVVGQHAVGQDFGFAFGGAAMQLPRLGNQIDAFLT